MIYVHSGQDLVDAQIEKPMFFTTTKIEIFAIAKEYSIL
jgi:hypothetical protein